MKRRTLWLAAAVAGAGALTAVPVLARRRWTRAEDPTGGEPLVLPPGTERAVYSPDGARIAVLDCGPPSAPAIVAVHGWTADRRVWGPVARRLVDAGRRVVIYDQRGHGASTVGTSGYTLDAIADDLRAVLEGLDLREAVVVGHSMGGIAAETFAVRHKEVLAERVATLVLVATLSKYLARNKRVLEAGYWSVTSPLVQRAYGSRRVGPLLVRNSVGKQPVWSHLVATQESFVATPPSVRGGFLRAMAGLDLDDSLSAISVPVIVIAGTRDTLTPYSRNRAIAEAIPGARLETVQGAGHQLEFEAPDRLARILLDASERGG